MNKFLATVAGVVFTVFFANSAFGQVAGPTGGGVQSTAPGAGQGKHAGQHAMIGRKLLKQLNLTPDQQAKVQALVKKQMEAAKAAQGTATPGAKPNRKAMMENRKKFMEELNAILTPEQQAKLKQLMEEAKKKKNGIGAPTAPATTGPVKTTGGGGF